MCDSVGDAKVVVGAAKVGSNGADRAVIGGACCNYGITVDGAGQNKAVIVIRMFADQIDPSRRANQ